MAEWTERRIPRIRPTQVSAGRPRVSEKTVKDRLVTDYYSFEASNWENDKPLTKKMFYDGLAYGGMSREGDGTQTFYYHFTPAGTWYWIAFSPDGKFKGVDTFDGGDLPIPKRSKKFP